MGLDLWRRAGGKILLTNHVTYEYAPLSKLSHTVKETVHSVYIFLMFVNRVIKNLSWNSGILNSDNTNLLFFFLNTDSGYHSCVTQYKWNWGNTKIIKYYNNKIPVMSASLHPSQLLTLCVTNKTLRWFSSSCGVASCVILLPWMGMGPVYGKKQHSSDHVAKVKKFSKCN